MANPTTNFGWVMPTATDLVTDLPADFNTFGQGVDTSMSELLGGTTGQILSKTSGTNMDFTWINNDQGDITAVNTTAPLAGGSTSGAVTLSVTTATTSATGVVQLSDSTSTTSSVLAATPTAVKSAYDLANGAIATSTLTTAGDVIYRNATVPTRLGIGTAGQVLTVNGGATAPQWSTPAAATSGLTLITTGTITATTSLSINSCFSATYDFYKILISTDAAAANQQTYLRMRVSGTDTTTSTYIRQNLEGDGATASAARSTDTAFPLMYQGISPGYASATIDIFNPFLTKPTQIQSNNLGGTWIDLFYGAQTGSTSYDGFTIYAGGNFTGKVKVYGYQNS